MQSIDWKCRRGSRGSSGGSSISRLLIAATLSVATASATADGHEVPDPCEGAAVLVCAALAIPLAIAAIDEAIDAACPEAFPPGEWPDDALAAGPAYPEQWYRRCNFVED